jgi:small subunit ribosomal protein S24e
VEISIIEDRPNPLLKRHEYRFEVAHATAATPSRDSVRGELSKLVKAPKDRIIIERMGARFGTATTRGDALVYDTADAAKSITRDHILVRNGLKEKTVKGATPPGESPAPAAPAETPSVEPAKSPASKEEPPKSEPKDEPKPDVKPEHKGESKSEHKGEPKSEHKPEHKAEHSGEAKAESHKGEPKAEHAGEPKTESHKAERKPKAPKAEKDAEPAKTE